MSQINKIFLAGAYGIPEILEYQRERLPSGWNYPSFFPFWEILPGVPVISAENHESDENSLLVIVNLNQMVWDKLSPQLAQYPHRVLIQTEAYLGWELAYQLVPKFDLFFNFDPTYREHPGFRQLNIPYDASFASSHRDRRGPRAWWAQWRHSKHMFFSIYAMRYFPRKQKAALIATLSAQERYQNRLRAAMKWQKHVDVYGAGWPKDLPNYYGVCMSKADVFRRYQFALVFENQRQPGYVTEKFLDCLLDGTVPIYWGDPTLISRLPAEMIYPIEDENGAIDRFVQDKKGYLERRSAIMAFRNRVFEAYSIRQFVDALYNGLKFFG